MSSLLVCQTLIGFAASPTLALASVVVATPRTLVAKVERVSDGDKITAIIRDIATVLTL